LLESSLCIAFVILKDHYHVYRFHADLQAQLPPEIVMNAGALQPFAVRQVATPLPPLAPKTNAFDHVRNNGHALWRAPILLPGSLVRHPHNFVHSRWWRVEPVGGIFPRRSAQHSVPESKHHKYEDYFFHGTPSFLLPRALLLRLHAVSSCTNPGGKFGHTKVSAILADQD